MFPCLEASDQAWHSRFGSQSSATAAPPFLGFLFCMAEREKVRMPQSIQKMFIKPSSDFLRMVSNTTGELTICGDD
ncbi:hypothetical protein ILYODFUR_032950 [Ilyodon furcidens]|uniref:Uncharacterized protein n=1 Tax=Ilyodon furcidens TaxID=33524 RepID=A0ABV0VAZ8_9TELE